ncbi:hypothetical protein BD410DRAFT_791930 [Rickenella mellea]|uniref:SUN domain-containing protein n=1 Tax=Rickenella mellea TaxID=50990 RepID=A0A4Y7PWH9_9AGAM|nr:hypothetical protein BD410DRAFT_791930 [Rickenella mellea]
MSIRLLQLSLFLLLLSSPALASNSTTPNDPFYNILTKLVKPPEPPICSLKPVPSPEPTEEFLSFEEWKSKQAALHAEGVKTPLPPPNHTGHHGNISVESALDDGLIQTTSLQKGASPPYFPVPLTDRFNYASLDCSARVHSAHTSAKSPASILSSKKDRYMLSPCSGSQQKFVVVELCEDIHIDTVQLANFEFFSGVFKDFNVSVAKTLTEGMTLAGTYTAKNVRGVQSFHPPTTLRDFYRYIRIDFISHYGNEYYCPISLLRVYGLTHLEHWKWDEWEAESRKKGDAEEVAASVLIVEMGSSVSEAEVRSEESAGTTPDSAMEPTNTDITSTPSISEPKTSSISIGTGPTIIATSSTSATQSPTSILDEARTHMHLRHTLPIVHGANETPSCTNQPSMSSSSSWSKSESISNSAQSSESSIPQSTLSNAVTTSLPSSSSPASATSSETHSDPSGSPISPTSTQSQTTTATHSKPLPTVVPQIPDPHAHPVPAVTSAGESIYRTIMNRLTLLETNSTLYARYVEEQTRSVREALRRLEEDVGRLEGIGKAQAQFFQRTSQDWLTQRDKLEREYVELLSRVNYLADEVILEKRLGIAQLALLLTVLVFMALTRGSRGESFISHTRVGGSSVSLKGGFGRRNSLREWGRRNLSFSGEWVKRFRSRSPTPAKGEEGSDGIGTEGKIKFPTRRSQEIELEPSLSRRTPSALKPRQQIPTRTPRTPATNRNSGSLRPATPTSARAAGFGGGTGGGGNNGMGGGGGRPQLQRSNSHSTPAGTIGPVPRSAKKWAKSAHLHEIQLGGAAAMRHRGHGAGSGGGGERERERERQRSADGGGVIRDISGKENVGNGGAAPAVALANAANGHAGGNGDVFWPSTPTPRMPKLGSPWTPNGVKSSPDADEADAWVDTDVEGSEGGQEVEYLAS